MIAKLRMWLSGGIWLPWAGPEHKDAALPDQREPRRGAGSQRRERDAECLRRRHQPSIVARQLDRLALLAQILGGCEMQRVQSANRDREGFQSTSQNRTIQLQQFDTCKQVASSRPMRVCAAVSMKPVPDFVFEQSAGN